jgi:ABC-2 type transport system permease protein
MLFNLVKKDFILAKKYLLLLIAIAVVVQIFITIKVNFSSGGFLGFFITVLYFEFMLFNTVSMLEDKYKGSALLCTTPYTRNTLVKAKYLFIRIYVCFYTLF